MKKMEDLVKENVGKVLGTRLRCENVPDATSTPKPTPSAKINQDSPSQQYEESAIGKGAGTWLHTPRLQNSSDVDFKNEIGSKLAQLKIDLQSYIALAKHGLKENKDNWLDDYEDKSESIQQELSNIEAECLFRHIPDFHTQLEELRVMIKYKHFVRT